MKEELRIKLCKIVDSLSWIPKSMRRASSIFYIHNIINLIKNGIPTNVTRPEWSVSLNFNQKVVLFPF